MYIVYLYIVFRHISFREHCFLHSVRLLLVTLLLILLLFIAYTLNGFQALIRNFFIIIITLRVNVKNIKVMLTVLWRTKEKKHGRYYIIIIIPFPTHFGLVTCTSLRAYNQYSTVNYLFIFLEIRTPCLLLWNWVSLVVLFIADLFLLPI